MNQNVASAKYKKLTRFMATAVKIATLLT